MTKSLFTLAAIALSSICHAHHSFNATFDPGKVIEIEGEVTRIIWRNPHVRFSVSARRGTLER
jgi:hypothetical protein